MPSNRAVIDVKPSNNVSNVTDVTAVYMETRVINKGQVVPWGLNWLITYPSAGTFTATRL